MHYLKIDKLFLKFLSSYILVLLLPILFINVLFSYHFIQSYQKEVHSQVDIDLNHVSNLIDTEIQTLSMIVNQMRMSLNFSTYRFDDNPLLGRTYMNTLSMYSTTNPFIHEMALYLRNEDYMFINNSTCKVDFFLEQLYQFENTTPIQLKELLSYSEHRIVLPEQLVITPGKVIQYITIFLPLYSDYQTIRGNCIFFIKSDTIRKIASNQLGKYDAIFEIKDQDNRIVFKSEPPPSVSNIPDQSYFTSTYISNQTGWTYTAYIPKNQHFIKKISLMNKDLLITTMLVLILSSFLIFLLMRMNYSPIHRLGQKASSLHHLPIPTGELETISSTLDFLYQQNEHLTSKLQSSLSAIKNTRLQKLLMGHYMNKENFNLDVEDLNLGYKNDCFFISVIQLHGQVEDMDTFARYIQELLLDSMESFYTFALEPYKLILINGIRQENQDNIEYILEQMRLTIKEEYHLDLTIGSGNLCSSTLSIPKSYLEASSALDYRFVKGNGTTILYSDLVKFSITSLPYPKRQFDHLKEAISHSDEVLIHKTVGSLIDYIQKKKLPLFVAKGICFDILSIFIETSISFPYSSSNTLNLSNLMQLDTVDDVINLIQKLNASLPPQSLEPVRQDSDILLEKIMAYIKDNCLRCDFSIQETAEHFHMLLPNLSQFFKEKTGKTILDYYTDFRMDKAKRLLLDYDFPLKDISQQVGYYNVPSFIRRFKQLNGITPGDYRKQLGRH